MEWQWQRQNNSGWREATDPKCAAASLLPRRSGLIYGFSPNVFFAVSDATSDIT